MNGLERSEAQNGCCSNGLVSLYDLMNRFRLDYYSLFLLTFQNVESESRNLDRLGVLFSEDKIGKFSKIVKGMGIILEGVEGDKSLVAQLESLVDLLEIGKERRPSVIEARVTPMLLGVETIVRNRLFMFIPEDQVAYYMNVEQFGKAVSAFPDALDDMFECANCYAAGRATACVFHSSRVAEHGLRHIAKELGIEISDGNKPCPIEYATWERVIVAIDNKRSEIRREPKSEEHNKRTRKYADLADVCSRIKDLWRNDTMHSRGIYTKPEALAAMSRVAEFMNILSGSEYAPPVPPETIVAMDGLIELCRDLRKME